MRARTLNALAGSGLLAMASAAGAQTASSTPGIVQSSGTDAGHTDLALEEIIVTARRREESLRDVPQTVDAVTSEEIQKLSILKFEDLSSVVPGLSLVSGNTGYNSTASIRGVTFQVTSQANPTVALYLNDAPVQANGLFQSMFDVGQVEVLRGPQGTVHGESAPSGAITITTYKPDLAHFQITANATESTSNEFDGPLATNVQAAINMPLVSDMLAVRMAALFDENAYDDVRSIHNPIGPYSGTQAGRVSVAFQPVDAFTAQVMYQHLERNIRAFQEVTGTGALGGTGTVPGSSPATPYPPAGFNGPPITADQRLSVQDGARQILQKFDVATGQLGLDVAGQHISYVGSYSKQDITLHTDLDTPNELPGYQAADTNLTSRIDTSDELRISNQETLWGMLDYTLGIYYELARPVTVGLQPASYLTGAFGFPVQSPYTVNTSYLLPINIYTSGHDAERSEFASVTLHLPRRTDLTLGAREIHYHNDDISNLTLGSAMIALPLSVLHLPSCAAAGFSSTYPGTCNRNIPSSPYQSTPNNATYTPRIYDISLLHHFSDDLMVYANTGSSWRAGPAIVGLTNGKTDAVWNSLIYLHPEESHAYELGLKAVLFDRRAEVNVAVFHQYFDGLITQELPVSFLSYSAPPQLSASIQQQAFVVNANSVVNGVDADMAFRVTRNWSVSGAFSYANGHMDHALVPCTPPGFNGTVAGFPAGSVVYECRSNQSISQAPSWNTTLQSEYSLSLSSHADGYIRGLLTYYPRNSNADQGYVINSYALLNLYLGLRDPDGRWDVSLFAKNATDTRVTTEKDFAQISETGGVTATFGPPGYYASSMTPPMELGVSVRYSFNGNR